LKTLYRIVGFGTLALVVLSLAGPAAAQAQDLYRVRISVPGASGIVTDCNPQGQLASVADTSVFRSG